MAEAPEGDPMPSSSENTEYIIESNLKDDEGPSPKKRKTVLIENEQIEKLENRLGGILCCAVCLDLPQAAVYQCSNGHLMCAPCFNHLLADARLRDETATCPNCRVEISKTLSSRNLAVEKTVSELPLECKHCTRVFPRHSLQHHEEKICEERPYKFSQLVVDSAPRNPFAGLVRIVTSVYWLLISALRRTYFISEVTEASVKRRRYHRVTGCRYASLGCGWRGAARGAAAHEAACAHPRRSAADLLELLARRERRAADDLLVYTQLLDLLSCEKITFNDLQLKPYRTEELHKLYYETSRFSAFAHQWVVKAFVNKNQRDPTQSSQREITYQLILKSKPSAAVCVSWVCVRGPYGDARVAPALAAHAFRDDEAAPARALPLHDAADTNRLLSGKAIHFRLIMFLTNK
ncbi:zinc finger TRAF-type-containing protein 1 homolog isoform X1 [Vanessa tameamea]|uniref:Zinc finger TRAF-type-containing protein 1 homolog isoform X1 n=1 Tax=Vanessa tameamea TaxID=334116 RepID=A0A8B8IHH1_VANTA|nr:cysteine and histidine-rich protein 1 isoform X1 [Vanessa tameamea]